MHPVYICLGKLLFNSLANHCSSEVAVIKVACLIGAQTLVDSDLMIFFLQRLEGCSSRNRAVSPSSDTL
jgi:hypothetical protein